MRAGGCFFANTNPRLACGSPPPCQGVSGGRAMSRLLVVLLLALSIHSHAAERVLDFHSDIRIAHNGVLTVTEIITVQAEGRQIRRGILRDFPTGYRDRYGNRVR